MSVAVRSANSQSCWSLAKKAVYRRTVIASQRVARMRGTPLARRPCESRDPYAVPFRSVQAFRPNERRWLWVPAFAGTTQEDSIVEQQTRVCPRGARRPSYAQSLAPLRAWGMPGARCTHSPACEVGSAHGSSPQVHRDHPAFPHAVVLTASFVLSPVTGLVCHRRQRILAVSVRSDRHASANLTPASGRQDHTTSPSAATSLVSVLCVAHGFIESALQPFRAQNAAASTASHPAFVTIMIRPSVGWDGGINKSVSIKWRSRIFLQRGLDTRINKLPVGQISRPAPRRSGALSFF